VDLKLPDTGISIVWGGVAAAAVTALAAISSAYISRQIKVFEFRQAWVHDLRKDIADYTGAAYRWFHKYYELELEHLDPDNLVSRQRAELMPIVNEANVFFRRIKLRFNPCGDSPDKAQDDAFLQTLSDLVNSSKLDQTHLSPSWDRLADQAVEQAREILKREWETTKHPLRRGITGCWRFLKQQLASGSEIVKARWASIRHR
jgi:hypothetical protein